VILSHEFWVERFGANPGAIGSTLRLDDQQHTIVGVLPAGFRPFEREMDVWLPIERKLPPQDMQWRFSYFLAVVARLKPGIGVEQARLDVDRIVQNIRRQAPDDISKGALVVPLLDQTVSRARAPLMLFFGAVGFVLLIACANVANLSLARSVARRREIALRVALGAGRARLVRQLFTESLVLAIGGAAAGIGVASVGVRLLLRLAPDEIPRAAEVHMDGAVFGFAMLAAISAALVFGLGPAFAAAGTDPQRRIKPPRSAVRSALVVSEIALALILTVGAGLLIESFRRVSAIDPGFDTRGLVTMRVALPKNRYGSLEKQSLFYGRMVDRLRMMPELQTASAIDGMPFTDGGFDNSFTIDGRAEPPAGQPLVADLRRADAGYFVAMGIPILQGRGLSDTAREDSPREFVISASMAHKYWPHESAIGKRLTVLFGPPGGIHGTIAGVAGDVRGALDATPRDLIYFPYIQGVNVGRMDLVLRPRAGATSPAAVARDVRAAIAAIDPEVPVYRLRTMPQMLSTSLATRSFQTTVLTIFATFAVLLAAVGIYGVLAYAVQSRTKELGIRTALGATAIQVFRGVAGQGLRLAVTGLAVGVVGALWLTRLLAKFLFDVRPTDPATFSVTVAILLLVALAAGYVPARRAARTDPLQALRHD
jgi:putative ABC transport system permease protein